jgi:hypothetical protein
MDLLFSFTPHYNPLRTIGALPPLVRGNLPWGLCKRVIKLREKLGTDTYNILETI